MKPSLFVTFLAAALSASLSFSTLACDREGGEGHKGKRHFMAQTKKEFRHAVSEYMIQAGDITQAELDDMQAQRKADKEELKALKASGDEAAYSERKLALKEAHKAKRAEIKAYIEANEDLKAQLTAMKEERRSKNKARREERREARGNQGGEAENS